MMEKNRFIIHIYCFDPCSDRTISISRNNETEDILLQFTKPANGFFAFDEQEEMKVKLLDEELNTYLKGR